MKIPAAQYLRMSTEHQQYSLDNQIGRPRCNSRVNDDVLVQSRNGRASFSHKLKLECYQDFTSTRMCSRRKEILLVRLRVLS